MRIFIFVELQQQRVNDDGNNLVPVERVSIPFACENNGNEPIITNDNDGSSIVKFNPENNRVIEQQIGTDFDKKEITVGYMFGASDVNGINLETNQNVSNKSIDTSQMEKVHILSFNYVCLCTCASNQSIRPSRKFYVSPLRTE